MFKRSSVCFGFGGGKAFLGDEFAGDLSLLRRFELVPFSEISELNAERIDALLEELGALDVPQSIEGLYIDKWLALSVRAGCIKLDREKGVSVEASGRDRARVIENQERLIADLEQLRFPNWLRYYARPKSTSTTSILPAEKSTKTNNVVVPEKASRFARWKWTRPFVAKNSWAPNQSGEVSKKHREIVHDEVADLPLVSPSRSWWRSWLPLRKKPERPAFPVEEAKAFHEFIKSQRNVEDRMDDSDRSQQSVADADSIDPVELTSEESSGRSTPASVDLIVEILNDAWGFSDESQDHTEKNIVERDEDGDAIFWV